MFVFTGVVVQNRVSLRRRSLLCWRCRACVRWASGVEPSVIAVSFVFALVPSCLRSRGYCRRTECRCGVVRFCGDAVVIRPSHPCRRLVYVAPEKSNVEVGRKFALWEKPGVVAAPL